MKNISKIAKHPSILYNFALGGRKAAIKKAVCISLSQISSVGKIDPITLTKDGNIHSLIGQIGGYSQEMLYFLVYYYKPSTVIETGVYRGISSSFILNAIKDNGFGRLYSIDLPMKRYLDDSGELDYSPLSSDEKTGFAIPEKLKLNWSLSLEDSRKKLPELLLKLGSIDLFYHDSEHTYDMMMWEYETVLPYIKDGGIICSDDVSWNSAFQDFCRNHKFTPHYFHDKFGFSIVEKN